MRCGPLHHLVFLFSSNYFYFYFTSFFPHISNSQKKSIGGGVAYSSWHHKDFFIADPRALLFTISPEMHYFPVQANRQRVALLGSSCNGPVFGWYQLSTQIQINCFLILFLTLSTNNINLYLFKLLPCLAYRQQWHCPFHRFVAKCAPTSLSTNCLSQNRFFFHKVLFPKTEKRHIITKEKSQGIYEGITMLFKHHFL